MPKDGNATRKDKQLDSTINSVSAKQFHQIKNWEAIIVLIGANRKKV